MGLKCVKMRDGSSNFAKCSNKRCTTFRREPMMAENFSLTDISSIIRCSFLRSFFNSKPFFNSNSVTSLKFAFLWVPGSGQNFFVTRERFDSS